MGGSSFLLSSLGIVLISSTYVMACCDEKGLGLLEALKEMKECKGLLKSSKLLEKEEYKAPPTLILTPAMPPQLPQACLPPPPPLYLPAPQAPIYLPPPPQYAPYPPQQPCLGPSLPPIYLPSPPPPFSFPPPPSYPPPSPCSCGLPSLPSLPGPLAITIVPPVAPPAYSTAASYPAPPAYPAPQPYPAPQFYPTAPKAYPAPQSYPAPQAYSAPQAYPAQQSYAQSSYAPPLPCGAAPIPMNAFMMQAPVPVTLEPKPIDYLPQPSCGCQAPPPLPCKYRYA